MIVAELEMPTGFSYDADALSKDKRVKRHELLGQNVAMYFDGVSHRLYNATVLRIIKLN